MTESKNKNPNKKIVSSSLLPQQLAASNQQFQPQRIIPITATTTINTATSVPEQYAIKPTSAATTTTTTKKWKIIRVSIFVIAIIVSIIVITVCVHTSSKKSHSQQIVTQDTQYHNVTKPTTAKPNNKRLSSHVPTMVPSLSIVTISPSPSIAVTTTVPNSEFPSSVPTSAAPTTAGPPTDDDVPITSIFYVIGDIPYEKNQEKILSQWMETLPPHIEFIVHVGDMRNAEHHPKCTKQQYVNVANILSLSPVPVFVLLGDNDWNDCPNADEGLQYWHEELYHFENRYWMANTTFDIQRQYAHLEDFAFVHKGTLFIGLNLVGGRVLNTNEWNDRLTDEVEWTIMLVRNYTSIPLYEPSGGKKLGKRIVLFGHCDPTSEHDGFFIPLRNFIQYELMNTVPILYVHGDNHKWLYEPSYLGQESFLRMMVSGLGKEPPLIMSVSSNASYTNTADVFVYDRQL